MPIVFVFSPLVGSPLTTSAKFAVVAKSPLTERINDSLSSSHFAIAGKKAGFDAIVVVGQADQLTCLVIDDGTVRFIDASAAAGKDADTTAEMLTDEIGSGYRFATIGPAGENLVRYATVSHDGRHAGRGGMGAVLGSKRLKAIGVRGTQRVTYANMDGLVALSRDLSERSLGPATAKYRELGTLGNLLTFNRLGTLPTRNFQTGSFDGAILLAPETLQPVLQQARESCAACTIGCEHIYRSTGRAGGVRMEYENVFALGPLCGVSDPEIVLEASALCDELGLDTISAGGTIAFAMECVERGLLPDNGLRFGNGAALLSTLREIGERRGLGELLAEGSRRAAEQIGQGSADFAPHVKGLEIPGYEPRALQTMAIGFAVGTRGADHNRSGAYQVDFSESVDRFNPTEREVQAAIITENEAALMDSLILCKFLRGVFTDKLDEMAQMLRLVTGWDTTPEELSLTAERIVAAKKLFNIRAGWQPEEDTLPRRFLSESLAANPGSEQPEQTGCEASLTAERLQEMIRCYNELRGWSSEGWIPAEELARLSLQEFDHREH